MTFTQKQELIELIQKYGAKSRRLGKVLGDFPEFSTKAIQAHDEACKQADKEALEAYQACLDHLFGSTRIIENT